MRRFIALCCCLLLTRVPPEVAVCQGVHLSLVQPSVDIG